MLNLKLNFMYSVFGSFCWMVCYAQFPPPKTSLSSFLNDIGRLCVSYGKSFFFTSARPLTSEVPVQI